MYREIDGTDERVRAIPGVRDRRVRATKVRLYMQQASVAALYMVMRKACDHYVDKTTNNYNGDLGILPYGALLTQPCSVQPHANYRFKSTKLALFSLFSHFSLYGDTCFSDDMDFQAGSYSQV